MAPGPSTEPERHKGTKHKRPQRQTCDALSQRHCLFRISLRDAALALHRGRCRYYAASDFVHVDVGCVRRW
ncbi:MAG: DUF882 domain-containing protein [Terriglobales bacterium]